MRQKKRTLCLLLTFTFLLSAPVPSRAEPSQAKQTSQQSFQAECLGYVDDFRAGDFSDFYQQASRDLKKALPMTEAKALWDQLCAQARTYTGRQFAATEEGNGGQNVVVTSVYSRYELRSTFHSADGETFDSLTFTLAPLTVSPVATETFEEIPLTLGYDPEKPLQGMLTLPKHVERPPVAILVPGSGAQGMDCLIGAADNRPFADLAHGLAERGVASIRFDKRSYAYPEDVTDLETEYLWDVKAIVQWALQKPEMDSDRLYLIGHSQGGMLAPKLAQDNPEVKGIVSLGGTLRRMEDIILEQNETMMAQNTVFTSEEKQAHLAQIKEQLAQVRRLTPDHPGDHKTFLLGYPESYWISLNQIDSRAIAEQLALPMLILQGDNDFQVFYEKDFLYWKEVLGDRSNVEFRHYPGLSHVFMPGSKERFDGSTYDPPAVMEPQVISHIADWISAQ